ncbi:hypothetical protein [Lysinibacillus xylanilyticus]|uniref:hypothetical protein n=1 Tax=Lysinibacillus xylanilyticus TaxID=582475 RepID=UPI003D089273
MFYLRDSGKCFICATATMFYLCESNKAPSRNGNQPQVMVMNQFFGINKTIKKTIYT